MRASGPAARSARTISRGGAAERSPPSRAGEDGGDQRRGSRGPPPLDRQHAEGGGERGGDELQGVGEQRLRRPRGVGGEEEEAEEERRLGEGDGEGRGAAVGEGGDRQVAHPAAEAAADPWRRLRRAAQEDGGEQHRRAAGCLLAEEDARHRGHEVGAEEHPGAERRRDHRHQGPHRQARADGEVEAEQGEEGGLAGAGHGGDDIVVGIQSPFLVSVEESDR